jgi:hypothetical protein
MGIGNAGQQDAAVTGGHFAASRWSEVRQLALAI